MLDGQPIADRIRAFGFEMHDTFGGIARDPKIAIAFLISQNERTSPRRFLVSCLLRTITLQGIAWLSQRHRVIVARSFARLTGGVFNLVGCRMEAREQKCCERFDFVRWQAGDQRRQTFAAW